jgi:hypothetical protein
MIVRNRRLQRLLAVLLVTLVAASAQAWASHVDWPVAGEGDHAHVEFSAFDDDASLDDLETAQSGETGHSDHCCHAAAHLVGLRSHAQDIDLAAGMRHGLAHPDGYASLAHPPLIDPPIA